jgi:hypothetical protein
MSVAGSRTTTLLGGSLVKRLRFFANGFVLSAGSNDRLTGFLTIKLYTTAPLPIRYLHDFWLGPNKFAEWFDAPGGYFDLSPGQELVYEWNGGIGLINPSNIAANLIIAVI